MKHGIYFFSLLLALLPTNLIYSMDAHEKTNYLSDKDEYTNVHIDDERAPILNHNSTENLHGTFTQNNTDPLNAVSTTQNIRPQIAQPISDKASCCYHIGAGVITGLICWSVAAVLFYGVCLEDNNCNHAAFGNPMNGPDFKSKYMNTIVMGGGSAAFALAGIVSGALIAKRCPCKKNCL